MKKKVKRIENVEIVEGRELGQLAAVKYLSKNKILVSNSLVNDAPLYIALIMAFTALISFDMGVYIISEKHLVLGVLLDVAKTFRSVIHGVF